MPPLSEEQKILRLTGIGSSEVGAIVGENPWSTCHSVWLKKRGLIEDEADSDATWLGHEMEPILARRYSVETGVELVPGPGTVVHPEHSWVLASPDFEHRDKARIVECKFVGMRVMAHWDLHAVDGVPPYVNLQAQWQMLARGIDRCDIAVVFGATADFRIFELEFSPRVAESLLKIVGEFWHENVLAGVAPAADHTEQAKEMLKILYGRNRKPLKPAPQDAAEWFARRAVAKGEVEMWTNEFDLASNKLREMIGDADGIQGSAGIATWKCDKNGKRTLRVYDKQKKEKAA